MIKNSSLALITCLCILGLSFGQTKISELTFESPGGYTTSITECNGSDNYFTRTNGSDISGTFSNIQGSWFFAAQDIDDSPCATGIPHFLNFDNINISGFTGLELRVHLAEDDDGSNEDWDASDYVRFQFRLDNGAWQNALWVESTGGTNTEPSLDAGFDGTGDGVQLITDTFTQFTQSLGGTGAEIDIRVGIRLDAGDEDIAIDNLEIWGTSTGGGCNLTASGLASISCNDNGTAAVSTDDYITFDLNPSGVNLGVSNQYNVSVSSGTISPTTATYGSATSFQLNNGSAGAGDVTITITDADDGSCQITNITITDPGNCSTPPCSELFISEYHEAASGNEKYIELYNPTAAAVNLGSYQLVQYNNGSGTVTYTLPLSGTIAAYSTFVIANNSSTLCPATADLCTTSSVMTFTGNDVVALQTTGGIPIDEIGIIGDASNFAADVVLRRNSTVQSPSVPYNSSEWTSSPANDTSDLGAYLSSCNPNPVITVSPTSISGMTYTEGFPPSSQAQFTVSGISLSANLVITAPSDFEVSLASAGPFSPSVSLTPSSGTVANTTIYVRLVSGLSSGVYSDIITASSTGASDQFVNAEGEVTSTSSTCGEEGFTNLTATTTGYTTGTYVGDNGVSWTYENARRATATTGSNEVITGTTVGFGTSGAFRRVYATSSTAGVGTVSYSVRSYFSSGDENDRSIELWVDGTLRTSFTLLSMGTVYTQSFTVNEPGAVVVEFRSTGSLHILLDDISWTCNDPVCSSSTMSLSPTSGPQGTFVEISGNNLDTAVAATGIEMGGVPIVGTYNSTSGNIEINIPSGVETAAIEVTNNAGCQVSQIFTVFDEDVTSCEGSLSSVPSGWTDVFISGVFDNTSGSCHYIELFNPNNVVVDLDAAGTDYSIAISNNQADAGPPYNYNQVVDLSGTIQPGETTMLQFASNLSPCTDCPNISADYLYSQVGFGVNGNSPDGVDRIILIKNSVNHDLWANTQYGSPGYVYTRNTGVAQAPTMTHSPGDWSSQGNPDCFGFELPTLYVPPIVNSQSNSAVGCDRSVTLSVNASEGYTGASPPDTKDLLYVWFYLAPGTNTWVQVTTAVPEFTFVPGNTDPDLTIDLTGSIDFFGYQFYCQIWEDDFQCYRSSNAERITAQRSIFSSAAWNTVPDISRLAIIDDVFLTGVNGGTNGNISACGLIVKSTRSLTVSNSSFVHVAGDVINDGTIEVEHQGNFVQDGDGAAAGVFVNNGTAAVDKRTVTYNQIPGNTFYYTYWSTPVQIASTTAVFPNAQGDRRFYFEAANYLDTDLNDIDDNADDWQWANSSPASDMEVGRGYVAATAPPIGFPFSDTAFFTNSGSGGLNTGNVDITLSRNDTELSDLNFNFIGNPYPGALDFAAFHAANSNIIDGVAYLWSHSSAENVANPGNEVLNYSVADYAVINVGSGNIAGSSGVIPTNYIPSAQGFFVQHRNSAAASSCGSVMCSTVTFTNSMREPDMTSNDQFFGIEDQTGQTVYGAHNNPVEKNRLWLNASSDNGAFNQILIAYVDGATDGNDGYLYDVKRTESNGNAMLFYSMFDDPTETEKLAIQGKEPGSLNEDEIIPLGFMTVIPEATIYRISIAQTEGSFFESNTVYLKDHYLNTVHQLNESAYSFTSEVGEFQDRFEILFNSEALSLDEEELLAASLSVIELDDDFMQFRIGGQNQISKIELFDMTGRKLYSLDAGNTSIVTERLSGLQQGAFIARVELSDRRVLIKKAIKRK